jgi:hypothetical protein
VPSFLDGLEGRDERYVVAVHRDFTVASHADGRDPHRADQLADAQRRRASPSSMCRAAGRRSAPGSSQRPTERPRYEPGNPGPPVS